MLKILSFIVWITFADIKSDDLHKRVQSARECAHIVNETWPKQSPKDIIEKYCFKPSWPERLTALYENTKQNTKQLTDELQRQPRRYDTCSTPCQRQEFFILEKQLMGMLYKDRARRRSEPVKNNYIRTHKGRREIDIGVCRGSCHRHDQKRISTELRGMNVINACLAYKYVPLKVFAITEHDKEITYKDIIIDKDGGCKCDGIITCG